MIDLLIIIAAVLISSGLLSLSEASITSMSTMKANVLAKTEGTKTALALKRVVDDKIKYLSVIIILNTLVNVGGSNLIGYVAGSVMGSFEVGIMSILFTLAVLYKAEMIPKLYAAENSEAVGKLVAIPLIYLAKALTPMLWLSRMICKPFVKNGHTPLVSLAEVKYINKMAAKEGLIKHAEYSIIKNILSLSERKAADVMICATELETLPENGLLIDNKDAILKSSHRRLVVLDELGTPVGVVGKVDLLTALVSETPGANISDFMHPILLAEPSTPITRLLMDLDSSEDHMAVIRDEDGTNLGALSIEDILHVIAGGFSVESPINKVACKKA